MVDAFSDFLKKNELKEEVDEIELDTFGYTGYPVPGKKFRLILEEHEETIEGMYYWFIEACKQDQGYYEFNKVVDSFAASEQSSFFGVSQQRLGLQQDKVSQYLQAVGKMIKEIFQFVRELRIIDERLELYRDSYNSNSKKAESADISLKGIWIDLVEGGAKNPGSVYGLAREVGFTILPDLFFAVRPKPNVSLEEVNKLTDESIRSAFQAEVDILDSTVDGIDGYNRKVKEVLKRKLRTYHEWKKRTFAELLTRRRFTLQYFRQHYDIIKMYMNWCKPYLRYVKRMHLDEKYMNSVDIISAFEGSVVEIEFIAKKNKPEFGDYYAVALINFIFRTRASMSFQGEGYQRGPKHSGKATITMRAYAWKQAVIDQYIGMRQREDVELMSTIDASLKEAMDALGSDLKAYLSEAGEKIFAEDAEKKKKEAEEAAKKKLKSQSAAEPFMALVNGLGDMLNAFSGGGGFSFFSAKGGPDLIVTGKQRGNAMGDAKTCVFRCFKNYRKGHKIVTY